MCKWLGISQLRSTPEITRKLGLAQALLEQETLTHGEAMSLLDLGETGTAQSAAPRTGCSLLKV